MKTFGEQVKTLKDGTPVMIREAEPNDAARLLTCIKTYIPQSEHIPKLESEIIMTVSDEELWIRSFLESANSLLLVAEYQNKIIGNIDLTGSRRKVMEHTAVIGMGMMSEWRNRGLGSALMESVLDWATSNPILELLWLQVYGDNEAGINLYKKMGFVETGRIPGFFRHNHRLSENVTMVRRVNKTWQTN